MEPKPSPVRKIFPRVLTILAVAVFALLTAASFAQSTASMSPQQEDALKGFLRAYVGNSKINQTTQYSAALANLSGGGVPEAIVYLTSGGWCGSGGCTLLILEQQGPAYTVVTKATVTRLPIRVLTTKSNGWFDLGVRVQGGGIFIPYEAALSFDGKTYPANPSVPPSRKLTEKVAGEVLITASAQAKPLF
jgi:hypothetical protein